MAEPILRLEGLCKDYGEGLVLNGLSLDVYPGEFLTLLGPSGCGKTTTLRIIAGLERPTAGRVLIDGTDVTGLPPEKRPVNTVFQNYALFPHMTVFQNIAYGLKVLGISKSEQKERVTSALSLVRLAGFERRMPSQLSGGQRQRVAIARAVVLQPKVLLLDEPLGALDLKLRQEMQQELKSLQQKLGITFVYITHDQEEALNMSSRIVILNAGHIEQIGTPEEIYEHPLFDSAALDAQERLWSLQGIRRSWFCGAYFGSGFHEDGLQAGLAVAEALGGVRRPWSVPNESGRIPILPRLEQAA